MHAQLRPQFAVKSLGEMEGTVDDPRFDIRMAVRALRAAPVVSVLAILCMGLGIGSVTTVYSTASAFTLNPLPQLTDAERLLLVADAPANAPQRGANVAQDRKRVV